MYTYRIKIKKVSGRLNESVLPSKVLVIKTKTKKSKEDLFLESKKYFKNRYGLTVESILVEASPRIDKDYENELDNDFDFEDSDELGHYYGMHAQKNHHTTRGKVDLKKLRNDIARAILDLNYNQMENSAGEADRLYIDLLGKVSLETVGGESYPSDNEFHSYYKAEKIYGSPKLKHGENRYSFDFSTYFGYGSLGVDMKYILEKLYDKIGDEYEDEESYEAVSFIYDDVKNEMIEVMESILESSDDVCASIQKYNDAIYGFIFENIVWYANKIVKDYMKMSKNKGAIRRNIRKI